MKSQEILRQKIREVNDQPKPITRDIFASTMDQILVDPQYIARSILRCEIISDRVKELNNEGELQLKRQTVRKLLPRLLKKDRPMIQLVNEFWSGRDIRIEHKPIFDSIEEIEEIELKSFEKVKEEDILCLPSFCPKVLSYIICYYDKSEEISIEVSTFENKILLEEDLKIFRNLINILIKFIKNNMKGYIKRVHHDQIIGKIEYQDQYQVNKDKFLHFVKHWPETTDPTKFVFEDIGIATFLNCLFQNPTTFIDLGCGNGLLTHLLTELGHDGLGVDINERKIWSQFQNTKLIVQTLLPYKAKFEQEWLLGNHADELTPWIPIMAAKSNYDTKFILIPCCYYDLNGKKYHAPRQSGESSYSSYIQYIEEIIDLCGYEVEKEYLRIPSTKNLCLIGRKRKFLKNDIISRDKILNQIEIFLKEIKFVPRLPKLGNISSLGRH